MHIAADSRASSSHPSFLLARRYIFACRAGSAISRTRMRHDLPTSMQLENVLFDTGALRLRTCLDVRLPLEDLARVCYRAMLQITRS